MDARQLAKIEAELKALRRRGSVTADDLESLAASLGRTRRSASGSHGQWLSAFPGVRPVTIARHTGDLKIGTKKAIIAALEEDLALWERRVQEDEE
jgi:hypothetical protein